MENIGDIALTLTGATTLARAFTSVFKSYLDTASSLTVSVMVFVFGIGSAFLLFLMQPAPFTRQSVAGCFVLGIMAGAAATGARKLDEKADDIRQEANDKEGN
jgi:hypothetical protein